MSCVVQVVQVPIFADRFGRRHGLQCMNEEVFLNIRNAGLQAADGPIARIKKAIRGSLRLHVQSVFISGTWATVELHAEAIAKAGWAFDNSGRTAWCRPCDRTSPTPRRWCGSSRRARPDQTGRPHHDSSGHFFHLRAGAACGMHTMLGALYPMPGKLTSKD